MVLILLFSLTYISCEKAFYLTLQLCGWNDGGMLEKQLYSRTCLKLYWNLKFLHGAKCNCFEFKILKKLVQKIKYSEEKGKYFKSTSFLSQVKNFILHSLLD